MIEYFSCLILNLFPTSFAIILVPVSLFRDLGEIRQRVNVFLSKYIDLLCMAFDFC